MVDMHSTLQNVSNIEKKKNFLVMCVHLILVHGIYTLHALCSDSVPSGRVVPYNNCVTYLCIGVSLNNERVTVVPVLMCLPSQSR